jgi:hypothetical protein
MLLWFRSNVSDLTAKIWDASQMPLACPSCTGGRLVRATKIEHMMGGFVK